VGLFAGFQTLLFEFVPYLAARNAAGKALHYIDNSKVDLAGLTLASHG
jgi:hypothetical protein